MAARLDQRVLWKCYQWKINKYDVINTNSISHQLLKSHYRKAPDFHRYDLRSSPVKYRLHETSWKSLRLYLRILYCLGTVGESFLEAAFFFYLGTVAYGSNDYRLNIGKRVEYMVCHSGHLQIINLLIQSYKDSQIWMCDFGQFTSIWNCVRRYCAALQPPWYHRTIVVMRMDALDCLHDFTIYVLRSMICACWALRVSWTNFCLN